MLLSLKNLIEENDFFCTQGTFFSDDSTTIQPDDDPLLGSMPVLPQDCVVNQWMAEEVKTFHGIKTPIAIILAKVLYVSVTIRSKSKTLYLLCMMNFMGVDVIHLVKQLSNYILTLLQ